ncbi:MAG: TonB-dependent receptor [Nitrosomonadales bacterium]|nr:TonB-dependent receptor [Nitrosomonadales bacterium]
MCASSVCAEEPPTLKEITVTAKGSDVAERRDATTQKIVLERKDIENLGVMTIGEVLGKLPGVEVNGDGQRARGMSRDSVQILVDGERSAGGARMGAAIVGRLPSGDLERVEILRGSSAEYGGSASVTVNLVMKKALPKRSTALKAAAGYRGSEPNAQFTLTNNGGEGGFAWTLPVTLNLHRMPTQSETDRQDTTAGTRSLWQQENEKGVYTFREFALSPRMTWKDGSDSLTISPTLFDGVGKRNSDMTQLAATPATASTLSFSGDRNSREESHRRMLRLRVEGEKLLGNSKFSGRASFNNRKSTADVVRVANPPSTSTEHSDSRENETNLALRLDRPIGEHLLAVGLEYINLRRNDDQVFTGSYTAINSDRARERQSIAWVQDDWKLLPGTTLTYGLRGESIALDSSGTAQQHGRVMPSLAVRWEPVDKWLLRSSFGAGLKMPRLEEISDTASPSIAANSPVEADRRGNPNLQPERSVNFEAVLERYLDDEAGVLGANFYARSTQNFTERRVQLEGVRWVDRPQNEGRAMHWGFELDGKVRTDSMGWKGATVKAHLTLPNARVEDTRLGVTRMARDTPGYVFSAGLDESLPSLQSSYGLTLQLSGRSVTDIPGEQRSVTQARTTLDGFWLYKLDPRLNLRFSGQNLLATDTVRETTYLSGGDTWQLRSVNGGFRAVLVALEGRW